MRSKWPWIAAGALAALALAFHVPGCDGKREGKPVVACTLPVLAHFVGRVGGPLVDVRLIVKPGEDPHAARATPEIARDVAASWAVFENGLGMEPWLDDVLKSAAGDHKRFSASRGVPRVNQANGVDPEPHAWLDPMKAITYVENARDMLIELDPGHETDFRMNADTLVEEIRSLDGWINTEVNSLSDKRRRLLLSHDSMRHFGARYRFQTRGLSPVGIAPSTQDLEDAVNWLAEDRIRVMFSEAGRSEEAMRQLSFDQRIAVHGPMWTDTLDAPGRPAGGYVGAMRENVERIVKALR
jgi:ABC-type Zn uptake system ZnuABC Zn-binding protein ZnuA